MKTNRNLTMGYGEAVTTGVVEIPAGTPVEPADNLPHGGWWVQRWSGFDEDNEELESYERNVGFHVSDQEVCEVVFRPPTDEELQGSWSTIPEGATMIDLDNPFAINVIEDLTRSGITVYESSVLYEVKMSPRGDFSIVCTRNQYAMGLTSIARDRLNGDCFFFLETPDE